MKKDRISIKKILAYEKAQMFPLTFIVSYILAPIYLFFSLCLMVLFAVFMEINEQEYFVHGLFCLGTFVLITIIFLSTVPYVRKKAIHAELARYDFDTSNVEALELFDFSTDDFSLKFDKHGMYVDEELIYYNHMNKTVITGNQCKRVQIYLQFAPSKDWSISLPVTPITLKMLDCLEIRLDNTEVLDYILSNQKAAFEQIYNKGTIRSSDV